MVAIKSGFIPPKTIIVFYYEPSRILLCPVLIFLTLRNINVLMMIQYQTSPLSAEVRSEELLTPALLCHKDTAQGTQSPLL